MAKVVVVGQEHRVLFEGSKEDAEAFVQANEPRPHIVEGEPVPQLKVVE